MNQRSAASSKSLTLNQRWSANERAHLARAQVPTRALELLELKERFVLLAETFQALGDTSRIQIVWLLAKLGELRVLDLTRMLKMSQPAVSHHLRTLRNLRLVRVRKNGRESFYALDDEHIDRLLEAGIEHVEDLVK